MIKNQKSPQSDTEIPFKTVHEALKIPDWKFIFNTGEEAIFVFPAKQVKGRFPIQTEN